MIRPSEITAFAHVDKTHGIHGEMSVTLFDRALDFDVEVAELHCVIFDMDGIYVPFFVKTVRPCGNSGILLTLDDVEADSDATAFVGKDIYALNSDLGEFDDDEYLTLDDMPGYTIVDTDGTKVGGITAVDDTTANVLFIVRRPDGSEIHVPAADELIVSVDTDTRQLHMNLPVGIY